MNANIHRSLKALPQWTKYLALLMLGTLVGMLLMFLMLPTPKAIEKSRSAPDLGPAVVPAVVKNLDRADSRVCTSEGTESQLTIYEGSPFMKAIVADLGLEEDTEVVFGTPLATLNNQTIVAVNSRIPLWRDLTQNTVGKDVLAIESGLVQAGHLQSADERFTSETQAAIDKAITAAGGPPGVTLGKDNTIPTAPGARFIGYDVSIGQQLLDGDTVFSISAGGTQFQCQIANTTSLHIGDEVNVTSSKGSGVAVIKQFGDSPRKNGTTMATIELKNDELTGSRDLTLRDIPETADAAQNAVFVPLGALWRENAGRLSVRVQKEDSYQDIPIEIGVVKDGWVQVSTGDVSEGDRLIINTAMTPPSPE